MNVASLENCKELYTQTGWDTESAWCKHGDADWQVWNETRQSDYATGDELYYPAYDLGFLLRQLPKVNLENDGFGWIATYGGEYGRADTPEDAACKLSIKLIKQRVLEKHA